MRFSDTTDPRFRSFVDVDPACGFPIQNLPYGIFSTPDDPKRRVGTAIGDYVVDLARLESTGLISIEGGVFSDDTLNRFMSFGPAVWSSVRRRISELLREDVPTLRDNAELRRRALVPLSQACMHMPIRVAGFTDFYSSRAHATNVGMMFRDKANALTPNWLHIPIGYNGRASTVVVSGTPVRRPYGQLKSPAMDSPIFAPTGKLDFELEIATILGQSSRMGEMLDEAAAEDMIFGFALLNDWSARDIQQWEYVPLGPFQAKAFATSLGPWIVTREALEPFRVGGPTQSPEPLPHLRQTRKNNYDIRLSASLRTKDMDPPEIITKTNFRHMYWSPVQQLMHHASSGCAMQLGDVLGSGTISGPERTQSGSLLELGWNGESLLTLASGESRKFLEDGDTVIIKGWCAGSGYRIGFGEVEGLVLPALEGPAGYSARYI